MNRDHARDHDRSRQGRHRLNACRRPRGAAALLAGADRETLAGGVVTASAGNMGQNAAWFARRLGVPCAVVVPPTAPAAKIDAMESLGARIIHAGADDWWKAFERRRAEGVEGVLIHAFDDPAVMAGNGTIGLEIAEDLPEVTRGQTGAGSLPCTIG